MRFSESFLTELAERNEISEVVGSYVQLSKRSGSNLFGLCPFHNEKTPSFSVSTGKQIYHCFGCGKGGGVINFIMDIEGLSFPDAVEFLAKRAGMQMPVQEEDAESKKRSRLLLLNKEAARFFFSQLSTPAGKKALNYMAGRGISPATAKNFGLGFAPDSWDSLRNAMKAKGFTDYELFDAGLVSKGKNGGFYDCFRDRLMFPVIDVSGNVIGFSGRMLGDYEPKYLNSRETLVFNKGRNLFGLNLAKKSKAGNIILVEGNVDVVSLHQAGFDSAVASLGTSLTPEQARLISRYTNEVVIAYDADSSGIKASQRAINILETLDVKVKVLRIQGAKDPDEFIKAKGPAAFRNLIEASESQIDYRLKDIQQKYDLTVPEHKVDFLKEATALVAGFPSPIERQVYSERVAELAKVSPEVVSKEVERRHSSLNFKAKKEAEKAAARPELAAQPADRDLKYENVASARAEEGVIRLLSLDPSLTAQADIEAEDFSSPALGHIFAALKASPGAGVNTLSGVLTPGEISLLVKINDQPENLSEGRETLRQYIAKIKDLKGDKGSADLLSLVKSKIEKGKGYINE